MSKQTERDAFRSRWGFILACIGSAVGMGNIWRFPYLVSAWGGMTFLLPYFLFVLLIWRSPSATAAWWAGSSSILRWRSTADSLPWDRI